MIEHTNIIEVGTMVRFLHDDVVIMVSGITLYYHHS